ncbi:unnamed protein product [Camellia sinensis]
MTLWSNNGPDLFFVLQIHSMLLWLICRKQFTGDDGLAIWLSRVELVHLQ